ncbi:MAG: alpha/beta hydrolase [Thermoleophilia bacterium]|nr:alpha/beta hydrolase [Thermoleophilia bacterium]
MPSPPNDQSVAPVSVPGVPDAIVVGAMSILIRFLFFLPDRLLTLLFGRPPEVAAGLQPDAWATARFTGLVEQDPYEQSPSEARQALETLSGAAAAPESPPGESEDHRLDLDGRSLRARLFRPETAPERGPLLVYFQGGGFVVGSLESHDPACRWLAARSGVRVLSVEYRRAPENPFPAAADDAFDAWQAVKSDPDRFGADPDRIGVGGDSAGGNLAAVLCQDLKRLERPQPAFQFLLYPVTVVGGRGSSYADFGSGYFLTAQSMSWYTDNYLAGQDPDQPRVAPLLGKDLSGLAPAYVVTALADPLRDEGEIYATRLHEAGVPVRLDRMPLIHGWFNATGSRSSRKALDVVSGVVAAHLESQPVGSTG